MKKCFPGSCPNRPYADDHLCYCDKVVKAEKRPIWLTLEEVHESWEIVREAEKNIKWLN